ncbi:hypothetical protein ACEQUB_01943 [Ralstonia syzygii]
MHLGGGLQDVRVALQRGLLGQHAIGLQLLLGGLDGGLGGLQRGLRVGDLFLRHGARAGDLLAAGQVFLGLGEVGFAHGERRSVGAGVRIQRAHLANRLRQRGLGLFQGDAGIGAVQLDQRLAGGDELRVVGADGDHGARDLRRHLHHVALHVRIVGRLEPAAIQAPVKTVADAGHHQGCSQGGQHALALAVTVLDGRGGWPARGQRRARLGACCHS